MTNDEMTIRNNSAEHRYEGLIDGHVVGWVEYRQFNSRTVIRHTVVDAAQRGNGIGGRLVQGVLDLLSTQHHTLTNYCGFVTRFIETHPDYRRLIDTTHPGTT